MNKFLCLQPPDPLPLLILTPAEARLDVRLPGPGPLVLTGNLQNVTVTKSIKYASGGNVALAALVEAHLVWVCELV